MVDREPIDESRAGSNPRATEPFPVELRFYEELNDFLPPAKRKRSYTVSCSGQRSVKDLIESQGVPHTELDLILVDGESVGFKYAVTEPCRIAIYPVFEALDITAVSRLGRPPLRRACFIGDVHVGKLVRWLRLLGFDCAYDRNWDDKELARRSADEHRILLTRDRGLLKRAIVAHGIYIRSDHPEDQVQQVLERLDLRGAARPFSRCLTCNGCLHPVRKTDVSERVPKMAFQLNDRYYECEDCLRVFWRGSHWQRLQNMVERALG